MDFLNERQKLHDFGPEFPENREKELINSEGFQTGNFLVNLFQIGHDIFGICKIQPIGSRNKRKRFFVLETIMLVAWWDFRPELSQEGNVLLSYPLIDGRVIL